jgi:hypothetical protein
MDINLAYRDNLNFYFLPKKQSQIRYIINSTTLYHGSPKPELIIINFTDMNPFEKGLGEDELIKVSFSESNYTSEVSDFIQRLEDRNFIIC